MLTYKLMTKYLTSEWLTNKTSFTDYAIAKQVARATMQNKGFSVTLLTFRTDSANGDEPYLINSEDM